MNNLNLDAKQQKLLEKIALFYVKGGFGLTDEVTEKELIKVAKLLRDPVVERYFNVLMEELKNPPKKEN